METNEVSRSKKALAITIQIIGVVVFFIGIRFGLIGGLIGGGIWGLLSTGARKINPKVGTKINQPVKHSKVWWVIMITFVLLIAILVTFSLL